MQSLGPFQSFQRIDDKRKHQGTSQALGDVFPHSWDIPTGSLETLRARFIVSGELGASVPLALSPFDGPSGGYKTMDAFAHPQEDSPFLPDPEPESKSDPEQGSPMPSESQPRYSIAAVSKLTGISCHTLRVWERRYGFPVPQRSASGHRRYDRTQVQLLCRLSDQNRGSAADRRAHRSSSY